MMMMTDYLKRVSFGLFLSLKVKLRIWEIHTRTLTPRRARYKETARPSLDVAPVKKISVTCFGSPFNMTPAVKVLPWHIRTRRFGWRFRNSVPPSFSSSIYIDRSQNHQTLPKTNNRRKDLWLVLHSWVSRI